MAILPWGRSGARFLVVALALAMAMLESINAAVDTNPVFNPCGDTRVQVLDGFTFGLAFSSNSSFFLGRSQLSPCDRRLSNLYSGRIAAFRPRVDEISLLTVNDTSTLNADNGNELYMVSYAGSRFGARSKPHFVGDNEKIVTSFTLVLEFRKGRLINMLWKGNDCKSCSDGRDDFVCLKSGDCAVRLSHCRHRGGRVDCSIGITVTFSGTDKNNVVLNTWYQVAKLQQYSLYNLYSNLKSSVWSQLFF
ncbi:uncharacterized protein LOC9657551 [Selaginella moellendorffii]|nr:uncharacterized protein LOC9657551 [Selaginella moellendorffii]|eukprot:XP_002977899.2 uncharacterized protein LOC9657551 [Selaginella moellendorffii]